MEKYIVVIAGNLQQFKAYVTEQLQHTQDELVYMASSDKISLIQKTFLYINNEYRLKGYNLPKNSQLVCIGTWYELGDDKIEKIRNEFKSRLRR